LCNLISLGCKRRGVNPLGLSRRNPLTSSLSQAADRSSSSNVDQAEVLPLHQEIKSGYLSFGQLHAYGRKPAILKVIRLPATLGNVTLNSSSLVG
jgi:hypothetical protein